MIRTLAQEVHALLDIDMYQETYYQNVFYQKLSKVPYLSVHKEVTVVYLVESCSLPFGYGRIDLLVIDAWGRHHIIELKVNSKTIGRATKQAERYLEHYTYGNVASCTVINFLRDSIHIRSILDGTLQVEPISYNSVGGSGISNELILKKTFQPE